MAEMIHGDAEEALRCSEKGSCAGRARLSQVRQLGVLQLQLHAVILVDLGSRVLKFRDDFRSMRNYTFAANV
eukprot:11986796-Alexandrium_andersonii.AAC.1